MALTTMIFVGQKKVPIKRPKNSPVLSQVKIFFHIFIFRGKGNSSVGALLMVVDYAVNHTVFYMQHLLHFDME